LEKSNAKREQDAHNPEFHATLEETVQRINQENEYEIHVKAKDSSTDDGKTSDPYSVCLSKAKECVQAHENNSRVNCGERDVEDCRSIEVWVTPVMAITAIEISGQHLKW
jgi:hypothetical protein